MGVVDGNRKWNRTVFAQIEADLSCGRLPHLLPLSPHASAGGARNLAISDRMSANICRDTATSAI
jgi:hypothetical protein